jgi:hypothetical protein
MSFIVTLLQYTLTTDFFISFQRVLSNAYQAVNDVMMSSCFVCLCKQTIFLQYVAVDTVNKLIQMAENSVHLIQTHSCHGVLKIMMN